MKPGEMQQKKIQSYHHQVRTETSKAQSMTSGEFYRQMEKSTGQKTTWIARSNSSGSNPRPKG